MYRLKTRLKMANAIPMSSEKTRNCLAAGLKVARRASAPRNGPVTV
jgi:hypothetical protein